MLPQDRIGNHPVFVPGNVALRATGHDVENSGNVLPPGDMAEIVCDNPPDILRKRNPKLGRAFVRTPLQCSLDGDLRA